MFRYYILDNIWIKHLQKYIFRKHIFWKSEIFIWFSQNLIFLKIRVFSIFRNISRKKTFLKIVVWKKNQKSFWLELFQKLIFFHRSKSKSCACSQSLIFAVVRLHRTKTLEVTSKKRWGGYLTFTQTLRSIDVTKSNIWTHRC